MIEGTYSIILKSPLGPKKGTIILHENGETVSGTLDVLGNSNPIENGKVDGNGFTFSGEIKTPVGKMEYEATVTVEDDTLTAVTVSKKGKMQITGTRIH